MSEADRQAAERQAQEHRGMGHSAAPLCCAGPRAQRSDHDDDSRKPESRHLAQGAGPHVTSRLLGWGFRL